MTTALGAILRASEAKALPCGVFGSFGWSGEAVDEMESRLRDAGFKFGFEPIRVKFKPTVGQLQVGPLVYIIHHCCLEASHPDDPPPSSLVHPCTVPSLGVARTWYIWVRHKKCCLEVRRWRILTIAFMSVRSVTCDAAGLRGKRH